MRTQAQLRRHDAERDLLLSSVLSRHAEWEMIMQGPAPGDREILDYAFAHMDLSPREVAEHLNVPVERVHDILRRDLAEVMRG